MIYGATKTHEQACAVTTDAARVLPLIPDSAASLIIPRDLHAALATAAEGFQAWDVLDAAHMLVASLIVDLVADGDRPGFLRKMDKVLRDRVKEIAARQRPALLVP